MSNVQRPVRFRKAVALQAANVELRSESGEEALGREHRMRFANSSDAMLPTFVAAKDSNFYSHEIYRHFHFCFRQTRHAHGVFFGSHNHGQIAADATIDEAS